MSARLKRLRQQRADKTKAMRAILDAAGENDLTAEQASQYDALDADQKKLAESIVREEALVGAEAEAARPAPSTPPVALEPAGRIGNGGNSTATVGVVGDDAAMRFSSLGEQLQAIIRAGKLMGVDPRLEHWNAAVTGHSEGVAADGGFAVQPDFLSEILTPVYNTGEIASRVRRFPIGPNANGVKFNIVDETSRATGSRWGGIQFRMVGEGDQGTPSKVKLRQYELNLKKAMGLYYLTDELMQDSVAMQNLLALGFSTELQFFIEDKFFRGSGAGEPLGLLASPANVAQAIEGTQTIANSTGFIVANVTKMKTHMPAGLYREAVWLANQELEPTLVGATLGGTAAAFPVYLQQGSLANSPYAQLLGRPLIYVDYCEAVGTPGDIMLVALGEYGCCDKGGAQGASSMHLRFDFDETAFRVVYRFDGAPTWKQSVTPYKGSAARSPIVTLATRS